MEQKESQSGGNTQKYFGDFSFSSELIDQIKSCSAQIESEKARFAIVLKHAKKLSNVQDVLVNHQIVYWDYLDSNLIHNITNSKNVDKLLFQVFGRKHSKNVTRLIADCNQRIQATPKKELFSESIYAFLKNKYSLCIVGLVSILDYLLSRSSGSTKTSIAKRVTLIKEKIVGGFELSSSELSEVLLWSTFTSIMNSLDEYYDFDGEEPLKLNRHWIMHGRSIRVYSAFDCIKLIRVIYALQVIHSGFHA